MPSPRFQHGFANDVFISYTHEDDHEEAGIRWVSRFEAELRSRLAKVSGQSIQIWRDDRLLNAHRFKAEIEGQLVSSAVLLPIVTPSYFNSEWCAAERAAFVERARSGRGLDVGNVARIVKVAKTRVPLVHYPEDLRELLEFRFYLEEPNGTTREFHFSSDPQVQRRFYTVVDDVAQSIEQILRGLENGSVPASKGFVYLGETSSDAEADRDQLRRSLVHRGYSVLPRAPLRLRTGPEAERVVLSDLARCDLAIYPVGAHYAPVLEESRDRSITELQLEVSLRDGAGAFGRLVWIPAGVVTDEERQRQLLRRIRTELPGRGFEVLESPLAEVETHVTDLLERRASDATLAAESGATERAEIYLMCLPADRPAARAVRDCLFSEGFEVKLPPAADESAAELHARRLESADAFLVFWGSANESWADLVLGEVKKAKGLRRGKPIRSSAVFLADPQTEGKLDYQTHSAVRLTGFSPVSLRQALAPLISTLGGAAGGNR